jgi:ADP-ribose pyrophosphatase YjhB (NUDIX family)
MAKTPVKISYCTQCGSGDVHFATPEGDSNPRYICGECNFIHYQNPNIIAGSLIVHEGRILLCKRAIEPRKGKWTLPAGFMENHESIAEAAARETWEEARARVRLHQLYSIFNLSHINQVYMIYYGELLGDAFAPGPESLEVRLFSVEEIPWDELAFSTIRETLKLYLADLESGELKIHCGDIVRPWVLKDPTHAALKNLVSK